MIPPRTVYAIQAEQAALDAFLRRASDEIMAGLGAAYWRAVGEGAAACIVKPDGSVQVVETGELFSDEDYGEK